MHTLSLSVIILKGMKPTREMSHKYKENDKQMAPGLD